MQEAIRNIGEIRKGVGEKDPSDPQLFVLDQMVEIGEDWLVQQVVHFTAAAVPEAGMRERPEAILERVRQEYAAKPHTPEFIRQTWKTMLGEWVALAKEADLTFDITIPIVPDCGRTQEQLEALQKDNKARVYVPSFGYPILARLFPKMRNDNVASGRACDDMSVEGWYDVSMDVTPQNLGITERGLREQAVDGWEVGSAKTLIMAGQASKVLKSQFLGENGHWFLVPNTRVDGEVAVARFSSDGYFGVVADWLPGIPGRSRGGLLQRK